MNTEVDEAVKLLMKLSLSNFNHQGYGSSINYRWSLLLRSIVGEKTALHRVFFTAHLPKPLLKVYQALSYHTLKSIKN